MTFKSKLIEHLRINIKNLEWDRMNIHFDNIEKYKKDNIKQGVYSDILNKIINNKFGSE